MDRQAARELEHALVDVLVGAGASPEVAEAYTDLEPYEQLWLISDHEAVRAAVKRRSFARPNRLGRVLRNTRPFHAAIASLEHLVLCDCAADAIVERAREWQIENQKVKHLLSLGCPTDWVDKWHA